MATAKERFTIRAHVRSLEIRAVEAAAVQSDVIRLPRPTRTHLVLRSALIEMLNRPLIGVLPAALIVRRQLDEALRHGFISLSQAASSP